MYLKPEKGTTKGRSLLAGASLYGVLSRANVGLKTIRTTRKYMYSILKRTKSFLRLQSISPAQKEQITAERARFAWLILFFLQRVLVVYYSTVLTVT